METPDPPALPEFKLFRPVEKLKALGSFLMGLGVPLHHSGLSDYPKHETEPMHYHSVTEDTEI